MAMCKDIELNAQDKVRVLLNMQLLETCICAHIISQLHESGSVSPCSNQCQIRQGCEHDSGKTKSRLSVSMPPKVMHSYNVLHYGYKKTTGRKLVMHWRCQIVDGNSLGSGTALRYLHMRRKEATALVWKQVYTVRIGQHREITERQGREWKGTAEEAAR